MEHTWARLHDYVPLTLNEIAARLARALLPPPSSATLLTTGEANTNYRVVLADGRLVMLRLHTRDSTGAAREAAIAHRLCGIVPVPRYLYVAPGEPWSVQEWIDGEPLVDILDRGEPVNCEPIGAALAAIGAVRFAEPGFLDADLNVAQPLGGLFDGYIGYLVRLLSDPLVVARLGSDLAACGRTWVEGQSPLLLPIAGRVALTHSDFKPSNLLMRDGHLVGIVDWEFADAGYPLLDIGLFFRDPRLATPPRLDAFARGYTSGGGFLPPHWLTAAHVFDLLSMCQFLARPDASDGLIATSVSQAALYISEPIVQP